jgi:hypothetical protein
MSADWSAIPVAVPYANLTNPQTLNLYAIVNDNPETFADLDGHTPGESRFNPYAVLEFYLGFLDQLTFSHPNLMPSDAVENQGADGVQQTRGRQPDGSYKAPNTPDSEINNPPSASIGNGECVTATAHFSGVTGDTSKWTAGKPALELTDADKGVAVATFDSNGKYFPKSREKNSGIYMGSSTRGSFWLLDQWPARTDSHGNVIRPARPPGERIISANGAYPSDNSRAYYVIIVP